jgi:hypothetical protein
MRQKGKEFDTLFDAFGFFLRVLHFNTFVFLLFSLEELLEGCGAEGVDGHAADGDSERGTGTSGDTLKEGGFLSGEFSLAALNIVITTTGKESITRGGLLQVLNADVDLLLDDASVDTLVEQNTDGTGSHVPDDTSLSVVVLVGHTLVNLTAGLNINNISNTEGTQIGGEVGGAVLTEGDGESVTSACAITVRVRHLYLLQQQGKETNIEKGGGDNYVSFQVICESQKKKNQHSLLSNHALFELPILPFVNNHIPYLTNNPYVALIALLLRIQTNTKHYYVPTSFKADYAP